ncbi:hypothetical protein HYR99_36660 [Candidatus Poribacteria bacterium]|nr:hypothetical protein [Candidatus Poribacteria bacterium]
MMGVTNKLIRKLIPKLISIEKEIAEKKGNFTLFGLFLREEDPHREWDLVISADWLDASTLESQRAIINEIQSQLERDEILALAIVLILDPSQPFVKEMNCEFEVEHGDLEFTDYDFNGMVFERAHIITSKGQREEVGK